MTNSIHTVLVTGGSGFVAVHCIQQLLNQGYKVRTTLRSLHKKDKVIAMLIKGGIMNFENLYFAVADLTNDDNWAEAVKGCDYVCTWPPPSF